MCGIAGGINVKRSCDAGPGPSLQVLRAMIGALQHRGPDGNGFYTDCGVGLAHARLSIIDIAGGTQPIHNEDESVWVVFNGEIFNYIELRRELEASGHAFYTRSDTEVIVHLYEQYGEEFVRRLNGQFAIALWDTRARKLVLARDRVGIRPLFYTRTQDSLLFASEAKALFAHPDVTPALDPIGLGETFTYWAAHAPRTVFKNVEMLPAGHIMTVVDGRIETRRYWDWEFAGDFSGGIDAAAERLQALLVDAVRLQVRADVPVGAYLSGGLDSSLIVALLKHFTDVPLRTFSLRFEDAEFDESDYQRALVKSLGTEHTEIVCSARDIAAAFPRTVYHTEAPILRTAATPLMVLSGHVREAGYKVVLTGEGADEVMAGYDLFKEAAVRRFWARNRNSRMRPALLSRLYPYLAHSPAATPAYAQRFFGQNLDAISQPYFAHLPRWQTTQRCWQFFGEGLRDALAGRDMAASLAAELPAEIVDWAPLARDQYVEAHTLLSDYLLATQGDRVAMANSIEGRVPYLDHRVIEFCNSLPARYKLMGLKEKFLLKRVASGLLPARIHTRHKQPYRAPDIKSFFQNERAVPYVEDMFDDAHMRARGYFDPAATRKLFEKCRRGRAIGFADNMAFVGILSTMLLDAHFIRQGAKDLPAARGSETVYRQAAMA